MKHVQIWASETYFGLVKLYFDYPGWLVRKRLSIYHVCIMFMHMYMYICAPDNDVYAWFMYNIYHVFCMCQ